MAHVVQMADVASSDAIPRHHIVSPFLISQNRCVAPPSSVPRAQNTLRAEICLLQGQATVSAPGRKLKTALDSVGRLKRSSHPAPLIWSASWRAAEHLRRPAAQKSFAVATSYPCGIKPQWLPI